MSAAMAHLTASLVPVARRLLSNGPGIRDAVLAGVGAALVVLVVGGLLVRVDPQRTRRVTDHVRYRPGEAFVVGAGVVLAVVVLAVVGLVVAPVVALALPLFLPVLLVGLVLSVVTTVLGYLAVGRYATDNWARVVLVGAGLAGVVASLGPVGAPVGVVVGCLGVGAAVVQYRNEYDREFEAFLAGPESIRSRVGVSTDGETVTAFAVTLSAWHASRRYDLARYVHDPDEPGSDVTEAGVRVRVYGEAGAVDVERVDGALPADEGLGRALSHLESNLDRFVREFEERPEVASEIAEVDLRRRFRDDAPFSADDLEAAHEALAEQRESVRAYLADVLVPTV